MKLEIICQNGVWITVLLLGGVLAFGRAALVLAAAVVASWLTTDRQIGERIEIFRIACGGSPPNGPVSRARQKLNS